MNLIRYADPKTFLERTSDFLVAHEAENNLIFGLAQRLVDFPTFYASFYLSVVEEEGAVVAAALRTVPHPVQLSYTEYPDAVRLIAEDMATLSDELSGVSARVPNSDLFARFWQEITGITAEVNMEMRLFSLTSVKMPTGVPGTMRMATMADRDLIAGWLDAFNIDALDEESNLERAIKSFDQRMQDPYGAFVLWETDHPVSMAGYTGKTPNGIRVNAVYTPPQERGHGYASACVASMSQHLLNQGRTFCFLYTDESNATANKIYQAIGYEFVCNVRQLVFDLGD